MKLNSILELREKAIAGDKEAATKYVEYAVIRKLEKEGIENKTAAELARLFIGMINVEVVNGWEFTTKCNSKSK